MGRSTKPKQETKGHTLKILSCVPKQLRTVKEKTDWIQKQCTENNIDILVTPQEYYGGAVINPDGRKSFKEEELLPQLSKIARKTDTALVVGVEEDFETENKEAIWIINEKGELIDKYFKFALPAYDHVCTKGFGDIVPETDFSNRFRTTELRGAHISVVFCWEAYSDLLWTGLGILKPDIIFSMIKFGVNAWPQVKLNKKKGVKEVVGFGYGTWKEDGKWRERLRVASLWQVKCPIISSTNSWDLRPISMPLCGCIAEIPGQAEESFWHPQKEEKLKEIPEKVIIDTINVDAVRASLRSKFEYADAIGHFPPFDIGKYTMHLKINRIEDRILSGREQNLVEKTMKKKGPKGFGLK